MSQLVNRNALYGRRWRKARLQHLAIHPLCWMCEARGVVRAAVAVDHDPPHRGDPERFWDRETWRSLCQVDHDATKQAIERGSALRGCDASGMPFDRGRAGQKLLALRPDTGAAVTITHPQN